MKSTLLWSAGAVVAALLLLGVYLGLVAPAMRDSREALVQARIVLKSAESRKEEIAGEAYRRDLDRLRDRAEVSLSKLVNQLEGQRVRTEAWFPGLAVREEGFPAWDEFGSAYAFAQDRLREDIRARVREASRLDITDIPLRIPLFQAQERDPRREEIQREQRGFNIERLLLSSAARAGAFPTEAIEIHEDWKAGDNDKSFHTTRVRMKLRLAPPQLAQLLRSLLVLESEGPTVRLAGLDTRPSPPPERLGLKDAVTIDAAVELDLVVFADRS